MDLLTLGSLIRFAEKLERNCQSLYEEAGQWQEAANIRENLAILLAQHRKNQAILQQLYNDSIYSDMDIGVQEPVAGLDSTSYLVEPENGKNHFQLLNEAETKTAQFYLDCAFQLKAKWPAKARSLEKLANGSIERKNMIATFIS